MSCVDGFPRRRNARSGVVGPKRMLSNTGVGRHPELRAGEPGAVPALRSYPVDSAQAAARLVALAMIADGRVAREELEVLHQGGYDRLGFAPDQLRESLQALCEDLLRGAEQRRSAACRVDPQTIAQVSSEIGDRGLRDALAHVCLRVAIADRDVSADELKLLLQIFEHWGVEGDPLLRALRDAGRTRRRRVPVA